MTYGTVGADIDLNGAGRVRFQILNFPSQLTDALTDWPAFTRFWRVSARQAGGRAVNLVIYV